jgi:hypothetical protein
VSELRNVPSADDGCRRPVCVPSLFDIFFGRLAKSFRQLAKRRKQGLLGKALATTYRDSAMRFEALEPRILLSAELIHQVDPGEALDARLRVDDVGGAPILRLIDNNPSGGILAEQLVKGFEELNGTVLTSYLLSAIDDAETPPLLEHRRIMETYGGPVVSTLSVYGQSLAEAVLETLARSCETIDRIGVLKAAETLQGFRSSLMLEGVEVNLGLEDHRAIQSLRVVEIQADGTLKALGDPIKTE